MDKEGIELYEPGENCVIIGIAALSVAQTVGACEYHSFFMLFVFPSLLMEGNFEIQQRGIGHRGHPSSWQYTTQLSNL